MSSQHKSLFCEAISLCLSLNNFLLCNNFVHFFVCPSFIVTIVIKKTYSGRTIVFALVSFVCHSVCSHRTTYPNLVNLYIKLKVFLPGTQKWCCKFCPENHRAKKILGDFFTFSQTNEL
jgi:hypothetical protein